MDENGISLCDSPIEASDPTVDEQTASLQSYITSVPYECETQEIMQAKLEEIVGKIFICAKSKNWLVLTTWDGMLQCWLLMKYPMPKATRAKLARLYYELCITPGIEARVVRSWTDMLNRLISTKTGVKRKLEAQDLLLPWEVLWEALKNHLWHKGKVHESSRSLTSLLLYVAELSNIYFGHDHVSKMLTTFLPLITRETYPVMIPVLVSFLPPTHTHLYLPTLFKFWEAINSALVDDISLHLAGQLSAEHVAGINGPAGEEGGAKWKDVGIWSQSEWDLLVTKGLGLMNVPVGASRGSSTTAQHADRLADKHGYKIKKVVDRYHALSKVFVYSISVDGPIRSSSASSSRQIAVTTGFAGGSKALDSLERLLTSVESFFHPSNSGAWTVALTTFLHRLVSEFVKRVNEEAKKDCVTPVSQRVSRGIIREFIVILRTPALLALFSKDPLSVGFAQGALRGLAFLEPSLIMPDLLERAYSGLEVVNETHRTTAVLSMLSGIARPLVTETLWLGGQKNLLPLLELSLPGIDLNDPNKTVCTTMFIVSAIQHVKLGDLSMHQSGVPLTDEIPDDDAMNVDDDMRFPDGAEGSMPVLSRADERALARDSTAGFADWVLALFQRVINLYENLPEEGGRRNLTGGKQEESVLKSIKAMMDVICLHLSDQLFELVLHMVFNYASTNAKSNAVRAFGQLVACLARVRPDQTLAKFLPFCISQIEEELKHGASNLRTTAPSAAVPSDTTFHWNLAILRGCLGYGGPLVLKYKDQVLRLLTILIDKTKGERGYSGTGRLVGRILHTMASIYPLSSRFVNTDEWSSKEFDRDHNVHWGRLYNVQEVNIEWHVPSDAEISFVLEILDKIGTPLLNKVEELVSRVNTWDSNDRNDFCRYINTCRSLWASLPTFIQEQPKSVPKPCINEETECVDLLVSHLSVHAGFVLQDPSDPRFIAASAHKARFGDVCYLAASTLRQKTEAEDHIDAVLNVIKAIDTFLLDYGMSKEGFDSMQKTYVQARDTTRMWNGQKENTRSAFVKRAQLYHCSRVYMHSLYRRRSELDDRLINEVLELSLSPYTRIRRQSQTVLHNIFGYYVRSTRFALPTLFGALSKGSDPDRMKGALYILWSKGIASYALSDQHAHNNYLVSLLEAQHEEKPSIQKLVGNLATDCLSHLHEDAVHTDAYSLESPRVDAALDDLVAEFSPSFVNASSLAESLAKSPRRVANRNALHIQTVSSILAISSRPQTHWRYVQMACRFLVSLLRRDVSVSEELVKFFFKHSTSPQPTISSEAQRGLRHFLAHVKFRTFSKTPVDLWSHHWVNPLTVVVPVNDPHQFLDILADVEGPLSNVYIDKIRTGFLAWTPTVKGYRRADDSFSFTWDSSSTASLDALRAGLATDTYFKDLLYLWSQESNRTGSIDLRSENVGYIKRLAKIYPYELFCPLIDLIDSMLFDSDKFKQRAAGEALAGLVRGAKHWPATSCTKLWDWLSGRLDRLFVEIKPDTLTFWETAILNILEDRDPRRNAPLVAWILSLPLDFHGDSAFQMSKSLNTFATLLESGDHVLGQKADSYIDLLLSNANTNYAEIRLLITQNLSSLVASQWRPVRSSVDELLLAVKSSPDPLFVGEARHRDLINNVVQRLPELRKQRLPPPYTNKSEYDKIALTLLQWTWISSYSPNAPSTLPYSVDLMPEIFRMSEFNDNAELQTYSTAVLYVLSAFTPPAWYIPVILENFVTAIKSSTSWRIRLQGLPALVVFFYRNLLSIKPEGVSSVMDMLLTCLSDENVEVREMASKALSGIVRCSQRQSIIALKTRFVTTVRKVKLPERKDPSYAESLRTLHSAILGICALIESFPYSVESWMPSLTEVLAPHATDPVPVSTTIRKCASEFKKTHQDTWHRDQLAFNEDQLQSLSAMLVGTSYYA